MNFGKDSDLFLHRKQEASTTFVGLFPNLVYIRQDFLPYYIIYPLSDFLLYPSHTSLFCSYSAISCEGCEGSSFTPAGGAARCTSTHIPFINSRFLRQISQYPISFVQKKNHSVSSDGQLPISLPSGLPFDLSSSLFLLQSGFLLLLPK
mgnify:CR=1 FL=1